MRTTGSGTTTIPFMHGTTFTSHKESSHVLYIGGIDKKTPSSCGAVFVKKVCVGGSVQTKQTSSVCLHIKTVM
jgi:hypothetical protein